MRENEDLSHERDELLEREAATSDILRMIARSPTDLQPVLDAVAESAARVCGAHDALIYRIDGDVLRLEAHYGPLPWMNEGMPCNRGSVTGRAIIDRQTIHIHDLAAEADDEFPIGKALQQRFGQRTVLATPLLCEGVAIGAIAIRRIEVRPFSARQIKLLETFADQAVIAIENARLIHEQQSHNRDLTEALEQQTATSEILRVISRSPTDLQPVLDTVAENAARVCGARDAHIFRIEGDLLRMVSSYGRLPVLDGFEEGLPINRNWVTGRAVVDRRTVHVDDLASKVPNEFPEGRDYARRFGHRTTLATPLLREGVPVGAILIRRGEVRPFSDKQVKLLETFADQAVIAIENVRLFQELEVRTRELARSVGELKALGEVGQAVSLSLDLETVLTTIVDHAVRLSGANGGVIYEYDEAKQEFLLRTSHHMEEELLEELRAAPIRLGEGAVGRTATIHAPVQVSDILDERGIHRTGPACACATRLSIHTRGSLASRGADRGRLSGLATGDGKVFAGGCESPSNVRHAVSFGDSKCTAVPRNRGEEPADRVGQPPQVGVSRQHVARATHASQCHHRLLGSLGGENVWRAKRETSRVYRRHPFLRPPSALPYQRDRGPFQGRGRADGARGCYI